MFDKENRNSLAFLLHWNNNSCCSLLFIKKEMWNSDGHGLYFIHQQPIDSILCEALTKFVIIPSFSFLFTNFSLKVDRNTWLYKWCKILCIINKVSLKMFPIFVFKYKDSTTILCEPKLLLLAIEKRRKLWI